VGKEGKPWDAKKRAVVLPRGLANQRDGKMREKRGVEDSGRKGDFNGTV